MGEAKTKKKKADAPEEEGVQVSASAQTIINVQNRKISELDQQNTMLQAMVIDQSKEIENLRAALDALAKEPKNREERRKVAKTNGKRK